ncbi:hypothetical protein WG66_006612 [Moniliophthora roreri]|nr:hypothetical protein WG66_006612 [Moniliophthora roreri]
MSYLMGQKEDTACSPSLQALTEVPLPSQLSIPRTEAMKLRHSIEIGRCWLVVLLPNLPRSAVELKLCIRELMA